VGWATAAVRQRIGRRGAALLFFAFLDLVYCWSLLDPPASARRSPSFVFLAGVAPLWAWAAAWGGVGVTCLVFALRREDAPAFTAAIGLKVMWGLLFAGGWLFAGLERGYVSAAVWLAFASLVGLLAGWPEVPRGESD
jgi:hypothetical protein